MYTPSGNCNHTRNGSHRKWTHTGMFIYMSRVYRYASMYSEDYGEPVNLNSLTRTLTLRFSMLQTEMLYLTTKEVV